MVRLSCLEASRPASAVLLQSGLDEKWWADSMECYCYLRNFKDFQADGRTPLRTAIWRTILKAKLFRLVQWLNIILFLRRTSQGSTNLVNSFTWNFPRICIVRGGIWKQDIMVAEIEKLPCSETQRKGHDNAEKW